MRNENKRNGIIIGALLITIALMTVGYATLAAQLSINGTANTGNASWNISFESITKNSTFSTTDAIENTAPTISGTAATFNIKLPQPGSKIAYDIVVQNTGTIDATFKQVTGIKELNETEPKTIKYTVDRLDSINGNVITGVGDLLTATKNYFRVTIEWPSNSTEVPTEITSKTGTIYLDYEQKTQ